MAGCRVPHAGRNWRRLVPALLGMAGLCAPAHAQYIETYLPAAVPGFDRVQGVSVLSRLRPLYQSQGVRLGSFVLRGGIEEKLGYDTNVTGTPRGPTSAFSETSPSISAESDWSRNRLGFAASLDRFDYFSAPAQNHTDFNVALGGGYTVLRSDLDFGYSHLHGHEFGSDAGAAAYDRPVTYDVDIVRSAYTVDRGRVQFTPNMDLRLYQFGDAVLAGRPISQGYRDRTVLSGGVTMRYNLSEQRGLVLVLQGASSHYLRPQPGSPSPNSKSLLVLPGLDYQATGPWRYRLMAGGEVRAFAAAQYGTRVAPVLEGSVIYTPTGLTTITASVRRAIEEPQSESTSGFTYTGLSLVVDHEYLRNVLLQARAAVRRVEYFQGGGKGIGTSFGAGVTWLVHNRLSLFANYRFDRQDGSSNRTLMFQTSASLPSYTRNVLLIGARWQL